MSRSLTSHEYPFQKLCLARGQKSNTNFFSQTFRAPPGYPGKIPGYPAKKFGLPGFRRTYRTFWPPPLNVEDPHPTRKYPDQKVWVWLPFSSLKIQSAPAELPNAYFRAKVCQQLPEQFPKPPLVGKQDVSNFALSNTAKTLQARHYLK